jgi:hypothetical protein
MEANIKTNNGDRIMNEYTLTMFFIIGTVFLLESIGVIEL